MAKLHSYHRFPREYRAPSIVSPRPLPPEGKHSLGILGEELGEVSEGCTRTHMGDQVYAHAQIGAHTHACAHTRTRTHSAPTPSTARNQGAVGAQALGNSTAHSLSPRQSRETSQVTQGPTRHQPLRLACKWYLFPESRFSLRTFP